MEAPSTIKPAAPAAENDTPGPSSWHRVAEVGAFDANPEGRVHARVNGRYISVIRYGDGELHCLDSVCFHAGGPLALGDIEELEGKPCLVCPWHFYHVSIRDGEKWYQAAQPGEDGKLHAGQWKSVGQRQRVHKVEERSDGIYIQLNLDGNLASDEYACKSECGARVRMGSLRLNTLNGGDREGSQSPGRPSSPLRGTPPASPRASLAMEGEDVWPEDLSADSPMFRTSSGRRRSSKTGGVNLTSGHSSPAQVPE